MDRDLGEYFKNTFRNMSGSSLPKSMPMTMGTGFLSDESGRKIMEEIKQSLSVAMVTTNQIVTAFYKMMGILASSSQIQDLAVKLEKENGTCRCSANAPCCVPKDKIEQINCKCLEDCYCNTPLSSNAVNDLKKGFYKVSKLDEILFAINKDLFWKRFKKFISMNELKEIREAVGYSMNQFHSDELSLKKIFIPIESAWNSISLSFRPSAKEVIPSEGKERIKILYLYCNYFGSNFSSIDITSTFRTPQEQTRIMIEDYFKKGEWGLYGNSEKIYRDIMSDESLTIEQRDKKAYDDILVNVQLQDHVETTPV